MISTLNKLYDSKYLKLYDNNSWLFASRKDRPVIEGNYRPDAVCVLAKHVPSNLIVVINQFRHSIDSFIYELPAGLLEAGETIVEAATRELKEETGLEIKDVLNVVGVSYPSIGMSDEIQALVLCTCEGRISIDGNQGDEQIEVQLWRPEDVMKKIESGLIVDGRLAMIGLLGV